MKKRLRLYWLLTFVLLFSLQTSAQNTAPTTDQNTTIDEKTADVSITANVTARELKFETVPNPIVEFPGKPARVNVWEADRQNLPRPVQPGVTYRNIGIQLRIASRFADIDRIVAEALGEVAPAEVESQTSPDSSQNEAEPIVNQTNSTTTPISKKLKRVAKANNRRK